jgi:hypothetical protein
MYQDKLVLMPTYAVTHPVTLATTFAAIESDIENKERKSPSNNASKFLLVLSCISPIQSSESFRTTLGELSETSWNLWTGGTACASLPLS